jgi:hypothetical protein
MNRIDTFMPVIDIFKKIEDVTLPGLAWDRGGAGTLRRRIE